MVKECKMCNAADVSDHNPLYLTINLNNRRRRTVWRLNLGIMNNDQTRQKVKTKKNKRCIEENNNDTVKNFYNSSFYLSFYLVHGNRIILFKVKEQGSCTQMKSINDITILQGVEVLERKTNKINEIKE